MKKHFIKILMISLSVLLIVTLVACNPNDGPNQPDDGKNSNQNQGDEYEPATFKVTFDSDGQTLFDSYNLSGVKYGSKIKKPSDKDGNEVIPIKRGYTFNFWAEDGGEEFDFETKTITKDTTLRAIWKANVYKHTFKFFEDKDKDKFEGKVSLPDDAQFNSTYGVSPEEFISPTSIIDGDYFVYWYYYNKEGEQVQFTTWANKANKGQQPDNVTALETFRQTKSLELFPMWHSNLPTVSVKFLDSKSDAVYNNIDFIINDTIPSTKTPNETNPDFEKSGYEFSHWYYTYLNDDEETITKIFKFDDTSTDEDAPTKLDEQITQAIENSKNRNLTLIAEWTKIYVINNSNDFDAFYQSLKDENTSDEDLSEMLSGEVRINGTIDLGGKTYAPLFLEEQPFEGVIDGGIYNDLQELSSSSMITNGIFEGCNNISIFGYNNGTIKNLNCENITLNIKQNDDGFANEILIAPLVSVNTGKVINCDSKIENNFYNTTNAIIAGGLVAKNKNGEITNCETTIDSSEINAEKINFGGITGINFGGILTNCLSTINGISTTAIDDGNGNNGMASSYIGGLVGNNNSGTIMTSRAVISATINSDKHGYFGGLAGCNDNKGYIKQSSATTSHITLTADSAFGGGITGYNKGTVINCHAAADITAKGKDKVFVGGIAGECFNDSTSTGVGDITYCYAITLDNKKITATALNKNTNINIGGLAGSIKNATLNKSFALCDIIANTTDGENNTPAKLGYVVGYINSSSVVSKVHYNDTFELKLDSVQYADKNFDATIKGNIVTESTLKTQNWLKTEIGFSEDIWVLADGSLPVLR